MPLKLMLITNDPRSAAFAESCGVDRIFIDLELRGKEERQSGRNTVISRHSFADVQRVKSALNTAKLLVRVNPIHDGSKAEIDRVIGDGADIVMLPYFCDAEEVRTFIDLSAGRVRACLLCETPSAVKNIDQILEEIGIDEIHVGLNDLHLGYGIKFMFELLTNGVVESLCEKFRAKKILYGFGGIGRMGGLDALPAERVLAEHYRLRSSMVILSRSFCGCALAEESDELRSGFKRSVDDLREAEKKLEKWTKDDFLRNRREVEEIVQRIAHPRRYEDTASS